VPEATSRTCVTPPADTTGIRNSTLGMRQSLASGIAAIEFDNFAV
jgi:hypothetical protein